MKSGNGNTRKRRNYHVLLKQEKNRSGAVLLFIIVTMIIMAVLGAAMVSIYSSSTVSQANPNQLRRAYYMAESGLRWAMGEVRTESSEYQRRTKMISLDGASRNVTANEGFSIKVYPYWLLFTGSGGSSSFTHTATVGGSGLPEGVSYPSGTIITLGPKVYYVSSASISSDRKSVTFTFQESFKIDAGRTYAGHVRILTIGSSQTITNGPGSSLTVALSNIDAIPKNHGCFTFGGDHYYYRKARVSGSNVVLSDITWGGGASDTIPGGAKLNIKYNAKLESVGTYRSVRVAIDHSTMTEKSDYMAYDGDPYENTTEARVTFESESLPEAFNSADLHNVSVKAYLATGGEHQYWAAFRRVKQDYDFTDPQNVDFKIAIKTVRLNGSIAEKLKNSWETYGRVSYDYQIKMGWGKDLSTAGQGINVRWHEASPGKFVGYGLSYIAYEGISYRDCWWIFCTNYNYDYIPNSIKPVDKDDHLWLVLWKQYLSGSEVHRKWLAYAELGSTTSSDRSSMRAPKIVGNQQSVDGILNDNAGVTIRVLDRWVYDASIPGRKRVTDILAFAMDASTKTGGDYYRISTGQANATDILRKRYIPEWAAGGSALFPTWPSNLLISVVGGLDDKVYRYWDNRFHTYNELDYFTLASNKPQNTSKLRWSARTSGESGMELLDDKATIRLSGGNQYVLDRGSWGGSRPELATHAMGEITSDGIFWGTRTVAFDDMSVQILGGVF